MRVALIAAVGRNRAIGRGGELIWRLSPDLRRFKRLTMGHPILMGRKTFESIGRALPGRTNIVLTRRSAFAVDGVVVVHSLSEALHAAARAPGGKDVFVIGGGELYAQALSLARCLHLTEVDDAPADADTFFPVFDDFHLAAEDGPHNEGALTYVFRRYDRDA